MQVELKPFALVNLGCLGNESRLVDCPVAGSTPDDGFTDYSSPDISCDPYHDTYARIACGSSDAASALCSVSMLASVLLPETCSAHTTSSVGAARRPCVLAQLPSALTSSAAVESFDPRGIAD